MAPSTSTIGEDCRVPCAAPFTQQQREDLDRLWKVQTREIQDDGNLPDQEQPIPKDSIPYMARLHAFVLAFLKKHTAVQPDCQATTTANSNSNNSSNNSNSNNTDHRDEERPDFLKDNLRESCLEPFYYRFVEKHARPVGAKTPKVSLGAGGRTVLMLHHEEFLSELNEYDFRGEFRSDSSQCIRHCFGAYLYHRPLDALPALNAA
eukprot:CAMPEP_0172364046 /NCGR_PEP_ID=MMETSP1060-20121228/7268_1 /TAXON_ID=37318 /ORGANISM="Pseudo-nitzschia pungens, Strain cf. cingulata" /LENGTH=205 /DNA_ID=CAMNT_0013086957 /DNA_START=348 /DNA_END=961 /DNA_ORIENTATION=+